MAKLPLMIEMNALPCLVVGGGIVATRKVDLLLESGAQITVVSPHLSSHLLSHLSAGRIHHIAATFCEEHLSAMRFVIAASDDESVNQAVAYAAELRGLLVNVVDDAKHSRAIFPSILRRAGLTIGISSEGSSPTLARLVRSFIAASLPRNLERISAHFSSWRRHIRAIVSEPEIRQRIWQHLLTDFPLNQFNEVDLDAINVAEQKAHSNIGQVYLVGAGPGDPQLLTLRAWGLLQQADVIVFDRLVSSEILALARRDAERIYVGKACANHTMSQTEINQCLIDLAKKGLTVVRLKGGDPFVFGRGGEEMLALRAANIPVAIVPGITAALGCAAAAQIPLTHRHIANRVQFLTAHSADDRLPDLDWASVNARDLSLVFYMGLKNVAQVCDTLIAHGRAPETPAAIISAGTSATQKNIYARLVDLPLHCHNAASPSLIVVGDVVTLAQDFESLKIAPPLSEPQTNSERATLAS